MEQLEKARQREAMRLGSNVLEPVTVNSVADIKNIIAPLDPRKNPAQPEIPLATTMTVGKDEYRVTAPTKSRSKRDMLVDGLQIIKNRIEDLDALHSSDEFLVNGKPMKPASVGDGVSGVTWVDQFISHWLGAYRDGILICWDLSDGHTYRYDIFAHKLTRIKRE